MTDATTTAARRLGLTLKERRDLGLTAGGVLAKVRELKAAGMVDQTTTRDELAAIVATELACDERYAPAWAALADKPQFDWESLTELVKIILDWLLIFLPLFL